MGEGDVCATHSSLQNATTYFLRQSGQGGSLLLDSPLKLLQEVVLRVPYQFTSVMKTASRLVLLV